MSQDSGGTANSVREALRTRAQVVKWLVGLWVIGWGSVILCIVTTFVSATINSQNAEKNLLRIQATRQAGTETARALPDATEGGAFGGAVQGEQSTPTEAAASTIVVGYTLLSPTPSPTLPASPTVRAVPRVTVVVHQETAIPPTPRPVATSTAKPALEPTEIQALPAPTQVAVQRYRVLPNDDGYVSVRAKATVNSREIVKLDTNTLVTCQGIVQGEAALGSNQWAHCPEQGGYILAILLRKVE